MKIIRSISELRSWRKSLAREVRLGFVPTMGALHEGHLSLVEISKSRCDLTAMSIFVNPTQFGPNEDFAKYPRPFEKDAQLAERAGVDLLFAPEASEILLQDASTAVIEEKVSLPLCGPIRPGHFRGVATIVLKLFNLVQPDVAVFGQKDAQQCAVIERMVRDLNLDVEIVRGPTLREADGLAMSSRNIYLSPEHRARASRIFQSLRAAEDAYFAGVRRTESLEKIGRDLLSEDTGFKIQYWEARDPESLERTERVSDDGVLFAVAAHLGTTRLIDNLWVHGTRPR